MSFPLACKLTHTHTDCSQNCYNSLVPTTFLPLRLLSLTSLLGILSSIVLLSVIIADGTIKTSSPGSLWEPMETNFGPNWKKLPICFGLMMSGVSFSLYSRVR